MERPDWHFDSESDDKLPRKIEMKNGKVMLDGKEVEMDSLKKQGIKLKTKPKDK